MDFLTNFLMEFLVDMYAELMMCIVPDRKGTSRKRQTVAAFLAIVMLLVNLALFLWGGELLLGRKSRWGWAPLLLAAGLSLAQIVLGLIVKHKKSKHGRNES